MTDPIDPIANPSSAAWARVQAACARARAATSGSDVVCHPSWPSPEAIELLSELEYDPVLAWDGWLDSTLDLRDGLSVVEVFAPTIEPEAVFALGGARR